MLNRRRKQDDQRGTTKLPSLHVKRLSAWLLVGLGSMLVVGEWRGVVAKPLPEGATNAPPKRHAAGRRASPPPQRRSAPRRRRPAKAPKTIRGMVAMLGRGDTHKRRRALKALSAVPSVPSLPWPALTRALSDKGWRVRRDTIALLSRLPQQQRDTKTWRDAVKAAVKDRHWRVRVAALDALKELSPIPQAIATAALQDTIWEVRERGLGLLGRTRPTPQNQALQQRLLRDPVWQVRAAAAWSLLNQFGQPGWSSSNIAALERAFVDPEPAVRLIARRGLVRAGATAALLRLSTSPQVNIRSLAAQGLADLPPSRVTTAVLQRLTTMLTDASPAARGTATEALGMLKTKHKGALQALIKRLTDKSHAVQSMAIWSLGRIGAPAVTPLARALRKQQLDAKMGAARALSAMGPAAAPATPFLVDAILDKSWRVRREVTWALYRIGPKVRTFLPSSMLPILINALRDHQWKVRYGLIHVLAAIGPKSKIVIGWFGPNAVSTIGLLQTLRKDPHPHVRRAARMALRKLAAP